MKLRSSETETGKFFQLEANGNLKGTITLSGQGTRSGDAKIKVECKFTADYANDGESPNDVDILNKTFEVDGRIDENGQLHNVGGTINHTDYIGFRIMSHDDLTNSKEWVVNDDGIYEKVDENSDKIYAIDGTFNGENLTKYELGGIFKISALEDDIELSCDDFSCKITPSVDVAINETIDLSTCTTIYSNSTKNTYATISGSFNFIDEIVNLDGSSQNKLSVSVVDTIKVDMGNGTVTTLKIVGVDSDGNPILLNETAIQYEIKDDNFSIYQQKSTIFEIKGGSLSGRVVIDITGTIKDPKIICNVQVWDTSSCGEIYANVVQSWGENDTDEVKNKFKFENFVELFSNGEIIDELKHGLKSISSLIFKYEGTDESTGEITDKLMGHFCFTYYTEAHDEWVIDLSTFRRNDVQIKNDLSSDNKQIIEVELSNDEFYHPERTVDVNGEEITLMSHKYGTGEGYLRPKFNFNLSSIEKGTSDDAVIHWSIDCVDTPRGVYSTQAFSIGNIVQKNIGAFEGVGAFYLNSHYSKFLSKSGSNHYDIYDIPFSVKPMINETTAHSSTHDFTVNWSGNLILDKDGKLYHDKITINESWETDNSGEALCLSGTVEFEYKKQTYVPSLKIYNTNKISLNQTVDLTDDVKYADGYSGKFGTVTLGVNVQGHVYDNVVAKITKTIFNGEEKVFDEVEYREVKIEEGTIESGTIPAKLEIKNIYLNYQNNNDTEYNELDGKINYITFYFSENGLVTKTDYKCDLHGRVGKKLGLDELSFQGKQGEIKNGTEITYNWWQLAGIHEDNLIIDDVKISGTVKLRVDEIIKNETTNSIKLSLINSNTTFKTSDDDTKKISGAIQGTIYATFDHDGNITQSLYIDLSDYHTEIKIGNYIGQKNYKLSGRIKLQGTKNRLKLVGEGFKIQVAEWAQQAIENFMIKYSPVVTQDKGDFNYTAQDNSEWQLIYIDDEPHNYTNIGDGDIGVQMATWKNFWDQSKNLRSVAELWLEPLTTSYLGTQIELIPNFNSENPIVIDAANIILDEENNNKITISNFNNYLTQNILWESGQTKCKNYTDVKIKSKIKAEIEEGEEGSENEIVLNLTDKNDKKIEKLIFKCGNFSNKRQCSIATVINNIKDESGNITDYGFDLININNPSPDTLYYYLSANANLCNWYADIKPNPYLNGGIEYSLFQVCYDCYNLVSVKADLSGVAQATSAFSGCYNLTTFDASLENLNKGTSMFYGCSNLTTFNSDLSSLTECENMFYECTSLKTFNASLSSLTNGTQMFYNCTALANFNSDLSSLANGTQMFYWCSNLTTFKSNLSSLTNGSYMFSWCKNLTTFKSNLSSLTEGNWMFSDCTNLTTFDLELKSLTNGEFMFDTCKNLTSFTSDLSSLTYGYGMFENCKNLTTFTSGSSGEPVNLSSLKNGGRMFRNCYSLTAFTSDLSSLTNGSMMFDECYNLTAFTSNLSSLTGGSSMFKGCTSLTEFTSDLSSLTNGNEMFLNCSLDAPSVQNIALTVNKNTTTSAFNFHIGIDTKIAGDAQVKRDLGLIKNKGWTLYVNGSTSTGNYTTPTYKACINVSDVASGYKDRNIVNGVWGEHLPKLEDGSKMFENCTTLTTFISDLSSLTNGTQMFNGCTDLTEFKSYLTSLTNGQRMFNDCKLNADSINKILNSIPQVTQTALLHLGINNTDEATSVIENILGFKPTTTETQATYKGWTIYVKINI